MSKAIACTFIILMFTSCFNSDSDIPIAIDIKYNDPKLYSLFDAIKEINRDSMGFAPLDSNAHISYKEEFEGKLVKLIFAKESYYTTLYFNKTDTRLTYDREEETTAGPRTMFVKDVDGYKAIIQETITRIYDSNKDELLGKNLYITFLDLDKYPDKRPYNQDSSVHIPQVVYETEISLEEANKVIARWKS